MDKTINKTITINAPVSKVWEVLTTPKLMMLWIFDTEVHVISDWKVGSSIVFNGKWYKKNYKDGGTILMFEKEKVFKYTYLSHLSRLPDIPENYIVIEFILKEEGDRTTLTLICSNFITEAIYGHWNFYWLVTLNVIKQVVENG